MSRLADPMSTFNLQHKSSDLGVVPPSYFVIEQLGFVHWSRAVTRQYIPLLLSLVQACVIGHLT